MVQSAFPNHEPRKRIPHSAMIHHAPPPMKIRLGVDFLVFVSWKLLCTSLGRKLFVVGNICLLEADRPHASAHCLSCIAQVL